MPLVIFVAPWFSEFAAHSIDALAGLAGVRVALISQEPLESLQSPLRDRVAAHWRVSDALDAAQIADAALALSRHLGPVHRLVGVLEQAQVAIAEARERLGVAGMGAEAARNFRDKARMKTLLREAGVPCARHRLAATEAEAFAFAEEVGYPLVVKPPAGAGSVSTFRVDDDAALGDALRVSAPAADNPALLEEFITGEEHSFETMSLDGHAVWHSLTRYYPTPLEVMSNPWIQWCLLLPREIDDARYDDIRRAAARALQVLGMDTGLSHMEWFRRADGSVAISEVGARPPGAQITTMISRACDIDFMAAWARLMVYGEFAPPERRYAVGAAFLRGQGRGEVRAVHGLEEAQREFGHLVTDVKLPREGQAPSSSYEGEGYVILRHPETAVVEQALSRLVSLIKVELG